MINPQQLIGNWHIGYALDIHTYVDNKGGYTKTDAGRRVYDVKYGNISKKEKEKKINELAMVTAAVIMEEYPQIKKLYPLIDFLFPVPFSTKRSFQPVDELVKKISNITKIPILPKKTIEKIKETKPLKDILEKEAKKEIEGAFRINNKKSFQDKNILVIDDIFGTGSTVTELTKIISPFFNTISILTMTKTRTNGGLKPSNNLPF
jgi:predicted amidophosphoribosyltransferase